MPSSASPDRAAVAAAVHAAAIHLLRRVREVDPEASIGPARLSALSVLVFAGAQRLTDLARLEQVRPPTMTKVVSGLARDGLARRRADPDDARAVRVEATAKGRRLLVGGRDRRVARLATGIARLGPADLDVLARASALMERIAADLPRVP